MRLSQAICRIFISRYDNEPAGNPPSLGWLVDRLLFHGCFDTGFYDLLTVLPKNYAAPALQVDLGEWCMHQAYFVLSHEVRHLDTDDIAERDRDYEGVAVFLRESTRAVSALGFKQPDYAHFLERLANSNESLNLRSYSPPGRGGINRRMLIEIACDIAALDVSVFKLRGFFRKEIWPAIVAIFSLQCMLLLGAGAGDIVRGLEPRTGEAIVAKQLSDISLRIFALTASVVGRLIRICPQRELMVLIPELNCLMAVRDALIKECLERMRARTRELLVGIKRLDPSEARWIVEDWGYHSDRTSKVLRPHGSFGA